jgi:hypothetical protein
LSVLLVIILLHGTEGAKPNLSAKIIYPIHPISRLLTITGGSEREHASSSPRNKYKKRRSYLLVFVVSIGSNWQKPSDRERKTKREDWESAIIAVEADDG